MENSLTLVNPSDAPVPRFRLVRFWVCDGRLEWPMPGSRWNYFIHGLTEYDEFKAFDTSLSGDTDFGYEWIQNETPNPKAALSRRS